MVWALSWQTLTSSRPSVSFPYSQLTGHCLVSSGRVSSMSTNAYRLGFVLPRFYSIGWPKPSSRYSGIPTASQISCTTWTISSQSVHLHPRRVGGSCTLSVVGLPLAPEKTEGLATRLPFLGIKLNSMEEWAHLLPDKLSEFRELIVVWRQRRKCQKRHLLSLIGKLSFVTKVIPAGRVFMWRLIDTSTTATRMHHRITVVDLIMRRPKNNYF